MMIRFSSVLQLLTVAAAVAPSDASNRLGGKKRKALDLKLPDEMSTKARISDPDVEEILSKKLVSLKNGKDEPATKQVGGPIFGGADNEGEGTGDAGADNPGTDSPGFNPMSDPWYPGTYPTNFGDDLMINIALDRYSMLV
jgi:hypothetical protein